ncbi:retron Ec67 family RNA-directed DNA polymerase/endonuclease [Bradyrhizobium cenepequi]|uniref:retron Ec67 family RNA-directed DNA polymerase/endonuclease n=1 Tax=Bradyrhizobium cenepequi TaxID=2821403 RepID=UPI001CE38ACB|nr:retron Ec67 family RNA-directed DNA polymerase/endonuclease [Bradyrhizobium cenepequi]MCA6110923.1 retron Ec67 family RNA-directed DNA polymerase/endonuclease [Bradyrhizobium cenepequi]
MTKLSQLRGARTLPQLARVLGVKPASLSFVLYWLADDQKYETFTIPKKGGGRRLITAPKPRLKMIQTKLADLLLDIHVELESARSRVQCQLAHGFKPDFSIVTNATAHRNKRYVFNADLKDFFPSINFGRVLGFFTKDHNFSLEPKVATVIAQIACHNNQLPQGSPCSPVISNLIAHVLDIHLSKVARAGRCTYTRYVDDLTFSTNEKEFPASVARLVSGRSDAWVPGDSLVKHVYRSGFKLNYDKTRMQRRGSRQDATGLIVNKKVNVRNEYYKIARAKCHHLFLNGFSYSDKDKKAISDNALEGTMSFIYHIRRLKTVDWQREQQSFYKLYRQFLDYRAFHGLLRPRIICEGKTDNIYIRSAIKALGAKFPEFIHSDPSKGLTVDFFNYTEAAVIFQDLSGGTGELKKLLTSYRPRLSSFKHAAPQPVIMIVDNDKGSTGLFHQLAHIIGKPVGGVDPFYHVLDNLYVVPVPKTGTEAAIEDLFDSALLKKTIKGRSFDRTGKAKDFTKWYSKVDFATQIVKPERSTIDFSGFEPLLKAILDVRKDFSLRPPVATAVARAAE